MAVKSIQLEKGLQQFQRTAFCYVFHTRSVWDVTDYKDMPGFRGSGKGAALAFYSEDGDAGHPGYCN